MGRKGQTPFHGQLEYGGSASGLQELLRYAAANRFRCDGGVVWIEEERGLRLQKIPFGRL